MKVASRLRAANLATHYDQMHGTRTIASLQVSVVSHSVNSDCLDRKSFVSATRTVASPQVAVVSHPKYSGCFDRTFTVSEPERYGNCQHSPS